MTDDNTTEAASSNLSSIQSEVSNHTHHANHLHPQCTFPQYTVRWLHTIHHDQTDIGVRRSHHYLSKRLSLYRKAFSVESLNTIGKDEEVITSKHSVFTDLNNNVLSSVLLPLGIRKKSISTTDIPVQFLSFKKLPNP